MLQQQTQPSLQRSIEVEDAEHKIQLKGTARKTLFPGFRAAYDVPQQDDEPTPVTSVTQYQALSQTKEGESIRSASPEKTQHSTRPPPRYSDASIIKSMEALGIGRPSTFASITDILVVRAQLLRLRCLRVVVVSEIRTAIQGNILSSATWPGAVCVSGASVS